MITNSRIAWGNSLGAQLTSLAALFYCGLRNEQDVVFYNELRFFRRGFQFLDVFDIDGLLIISRYGEKFNNLLKKYSISHKKRQHNWKTEMRRIYRNPIRKYMDELIYRGVIWRYKDFSKIDLLKDDVKMDPKLLTLAKWKNYDILRGFGTYRDYENYADRILNRFHFKDEIVREGNIILNSLPKDKKLVSIHFRLTDYLVLSSLNLSIDYYKKSMDMFDKNNYRFLVFSDDIENCKSMSFLYEYDVLFLSTGKPGVDMFLMSKCNCNIIANSSFSLWGALLNKNEDKKVVCPHDFIGVSAKEYLFINGNYYPKDWIAI